MFAVYISSQVPCGADIKLGTVDFCSLDSAKKKQIHREKVK